MFWVYCALAFMFSAGIYLALWSTTTFTISRMTPVWIFPAYPLLVIGPHAGVLSGKLLGTRGLDVIIGGFIFQGIGFMVALMIYAAFIYRLMTQKLPTESVRPGMFISVGPSGFTIAGIINMGQVIPDVIPADFMGVGEVAGTISLVVANWMGLWLWGLAIFFFTVSVGAHWSCVGHGKMHFAMTWYSFIFPNTALITATFSVGKALKARPIQIVGCVMTCLLILTWFFVFYNMIRAVVQKEILWPQKQEDRDEGGWKTEVREAMEGQRRDAQRNAQQGEPGQIDVEPESPEIVPRLPRSRSDPPGVSTTIAYPKLPSPSNSAMLMSGARFIATGSEVCSPEPASSGATVPGAPDFSSHVEAANSTTASASASTSVSASLHSLAHASCGFPHTGQS
ncbi:hypothetical protein M8818_007701 [Zalaria obscura]|uniref:Uncharacterized protein n=1 Tax=Zalaria obscura TaxID=2024903 RepID=A0ACC3S3B0_9PEZI